MVKKYTLHAHVSTENPRAIRRALSGLLPGASIAAAEGGYLVDGAMRGATARELNRNLLSALRRVERRTRLRAQWTSGGITERFFDYVPKGSSKASRS